MAERLINSNLLPASTDLQPVTKVLDHGYVQLVEAWGSEERIIEAARMSTGKGFQGWGPVPCEGCDGRGHVTLQAPDGHRTDVCQVCKGRGSLAGDEKLLTYLYNHGHHSPFEMAGMIVEVQAPIMVFREWMRHRTQSFNEFSGRYAEMPNMAYLPSPERLKGAKQSTTNKQGSAEGLSEEASAVALKAISESTYQAWTQYRRMLDAGVSREIARLVLPLNQYSRMRASANLRNWLHFLELRLDPAAQWEIRQYAQVVADLVRERFPRTYELAMGNNHGNHL